MPQALELIDSEPGEIKLRGALTFATAKNARAAGARLIEASADAALEVDLSAVSESDSAGLAVLLDWLAIAKRHGRSLRFKALPGPIRAVAGLSNVEGILNQGFKAEIAPTVSE